MVSLGDENFLFLTDEELSKGLNWTMYPLKPFSDLFVDSVNKVISVLATAEPICEMTFVTSQAFSHVQSHANQ